MNIMAFDIGGTAIKYGLIDENFNIVVSDEMPTNAFFGAQAVVKSIEKKLDEYSGQFNAIGISTAGQVDFATGVIVYGSDNIPGCSGLDFRGIFGEKYGVPVAVDNDVNCAGMGEAHFGAGRGEDSFLCLTYGTGVGGCIYWNGDVYRGAKSAAGEFGHMATHAGGRECTCGRKGCYEAYASCRALTDVVSERFDRYMSGREIFKEENLKNPIIIEELDNWENEIVNGLVSLCYIFNPTLIVMGGGIMSEDLLIGHIREKLYERVGVNYRGVRVEKAQLRNKAGLLGAAYIAKERLENLSK